jgi:hypothetical protein
MPHMPLDVLGIVFAVVGLPAAIYGLYQLALDFPGIFDSLRPATHGNSKKNFRVRSTTLKALIGEEETEVIKLRKIRVYRKQSLLDEFDYVPEVYDPAHPNDSRPARIKGLYSIPGTAQDNAENYVSVRLNGDEEPFLPLRDHNVVVGYVLTEKIDDLFKPGPPQLMARAPAGWERLVIEVHLPPGLQFQHDQHSGAPRARTFTNEPNQSRSEIPAKVTRYIHDFNDGRGQVEWVRAVMKKLPKKGHTGIVLEWEWERKVSSPVDRSVGGARGS